MGEHRFPREVPKGTSRTTATRRKAFERANDHIKALTECRVHLPDGRTVDEIVEAHPHGMTLREIGDLYGLTRERIRQIEERAVRRFALIASFVAPNLAADRFITADDEREPGDWEDASSNGTLLVAGSFGGEQ